MRTHPFKRTGIAFVTLLLLVGTMFWGHIQRPLKHWWAVKADSTAQVLPLTQNWTTTTLITANDNWSGVPGIEGYLGQDITTGIGVDPQTLLTTSAVAGDLTVLANQSNPNITNGDVAEFDGIANPTIALQGSGTADAPYVQFYLNTTGLQNINVAYNLRDLDATTDNAVQPVALQFRVGNSGNFTNVPAGFVADATTGPSLATLVTPVSATLPAACDNQALVQVRVITANATGNDEWVGVDDISITGSTLCMPTTVTNLNDSGAGSLRQAILNANTCAGTDTITFSVTGTINLLSSLPAITESVNITGPGANQLTVIGTNLFQLMAVNTVGVNLTISGLTFNGGSAPTGFNAGALEYNSAGGTLTITNCAFVNNASPSGTSVIYSNASGGMQITGTTFSFNPSVGLTITVDGTPLTISNCTFAGNADGIFVRNATANVSSSTFANHTGIAIRISAVGTSVLNLKNSIVANNGINILNSGTFTSQGNNLCSDASLTPAAGGDLINTNPLLGALTNNGGTTQTLALLPGSPAINAGNNTGAPATDQRGIARVGNVDIGAFESQGFTMALASGNNQSTTVSTNFTNPLAVMVTSAFSEPVNGGRVTFTPPGAGASCTIAGNPATISGNMATTGTVTANAVAGGPYTVTASANGSTSTNFSLTNTAVGNAPPTITAGGTFFRQQGAAAINSQIATVTDDAGNGTVTVTATTVPAGITVTNIVNTGGNITADVAADCTAALGNNTVTLTATDTGSLTATANLTVNVTAPSTVVTNGNDSGAGSLRQAILDACPGATITFSGVSTVTLTTAELLINKNLTITGGGGVTVTRGAGSPNFRIFNLASGRTATFTSMTISNGNAGDGGGIFNNNGNLTLNQCVVSGNTSTNTGGGGGGIRNSGVLQVTDCVISGNTAALLGGGVWNRSGGVAANGTFTNTTIAGNQAASGAGIHNNGASLNLTNCTISGNSANAIDPTGGASGLENTAQSFATTATLVNCTFSNNQHTSSSDPTADDIYSGNFGTQATVFLKNTILGGSAATATPNLRTFQGGIITSQGNNLSSDNGAGFLNQPGDIINTAPLVATLANNGGTTQTHALLPGSPAINGGTAAGAPTTDQRGIARVGNVDIGAFESRGFTMALASGNNQSTTVSTNFTNPLAVMVTSAFSEPVNGGQVTFTPPGAGASCTIAGNPATISGNMATTGTVTANAVAGGPYTVTASANGSTSTNFSLTNTAVGNAPPTITAGGTLTRQRGAAAINSQIAIVTDDAGNGTVTVTATTVPAGITVTNIVNAGGTITADVAASCTAALGSNTVMLTATDTGSLTATATFTVNVTANTAPTLTYASPQTVAFGGSLMVNPATGPTDNGTIASIVVQSQGTYTGTISVNNSTGMVSISNARPAPGPHTITIRATDNCGLFTDASFTLNVTCPPTVVTNGNDSGAGSLRQIITDACAGSTITFSGVSTVTLTTAELLVSVNNLTIDGGAAGVTITRSTAGGTPNFRLLNCLGQNITFSKLTLTNGNVSGFGGAIRCFGAGTVIINDCIVQNNTNSGGTQGGGISASFCNLTVNRSLIDNNQGISGVYIQDGNGTITDSTISNQRGFGGGVRFQGNSNAVLTMTNCTISGNTPSSEESALRLGASTGVTLTATLTNCTIANNTTTASGFAAINQTGGGTNVLNLKNTIVSGNLSGGIAADSLATIAAGSSNNLIGVGGGLINGVNGNIVGITNPLVGAAGNNGGTTPTCALLPGSPAINGGTAAGAPTTDQRGIARVGNVDIGAFESRGFTMAVASGTPQTTNISTAFTNPLVVTVTSAFSEPVNGGQVTFTPPGSGASCTIAGNPASISGGTATTGTVTANSNAGGPYTVTATANGSTSANFSLTNVSPNGIAAIQSTNSPEGTWTGFAGAAWQGTVGWSFTVGATGISVTRLGIYDAGSNGLAESHQIGLWNSGGTLLASVTIPAGAAGSLDTGYRYQPITPVFLMPGQSYVIGAFYSVQSGDNILIASTQTIASQITFGQSRQTILSPGATFGLPNVDAGLSQGVFGPNFQFAGCPAITVTNPATTTGTAGTAFSQTFTQSGGNGMVSFAVATGTLPSGLTLSTAGVLSGTPTQTGTFPITVRATDQNGCQGTGTTYNLVINCQTVTVTNPATTTGTAGAAFSQTFTQTGGIGTTNFTTSSTLPTGLTLSTGGVLSGTPTQTGTFPIVVRATDQNGCFGNGATYNLVINCQTITVTNPATTTGTAGAAFSQTFTQTGGIGTTNFTTSSTLPTGLTLSTGGVLSGTPTQTGTFPIVVRATDQNGCFGNGATYNLVIACQVITVNPATIPAGTVGAVYPAQTFTQTGGIGTTTISMPSGTLPAGVTFNAGTATLSGTPTQTGTFTFVIRATDQNGCTGQRSYALVVNCQTITVGPATIASGTAGTAYTQTFTQTGGTGTVTFAVSGTLPSGVTFNAGTATLSGTPTQTGNFNLTVTATDQNGCTGVRGYTLAIACPTIAVTPATVPNGTSGTPYNLTFGNTGAIGSVSYSRTGTLPTGLNFSSTGALSGTPTQIGTFNFSVTVTDQNGCTGTQSYTLTVVCPTILVGPATIATGFQGVAYSQTFTQTGGSGTVTFTAGGTLPPGLTLSSAGVLSGTPTTAGSFTFTVTATDQNLCTGTQSYTLMVRARPVIVAGGPLTRQQGSAGTAATIATVSDTETPAGSLTVVATVVPAGISVTGLTNTNGTITATVAASCTAAVGANTVVLTVTDGDSLTATANLTVNVTANTAPTLGTYPSQSNVTLGTTVTVTPSTAPADNGTVASVTVTASAGYAGTLTVNPATGVVTANPVNNGTFTITVTATDNCGATTTATFTLSTLVFDKAPVITGISPNIGTVGTAVTITGINLDKVNTVRFNGTVATVFTIDSATQITATVPALATTGPVTASGTTGTGTGPTFTVIRTK